MVRPDDVRSCLAVAFGAIILLAGGCGQAPAARPDGSAPSAGETTRAAPRRPAVAVRQGSLPFEALPAAARFRMPVPGTAVVRTREEWLRLWSLFGKPQERAAGPPPIDFQDSMVIAVGDGVTSGCRPERDLVGTIELVGDTVRVRLRKGKDSGGLCQELVESLQMVRVARVDAPVVFEGLPVGPDWLQSTARPPR